MTSKSCITRTLAFDISSVRTQRGFIEGEFSHMPRYFFHVKHGQVTVLDHHGAELMGIEEAIEEAARRGREIAERDASRGLVPSGGVIVVANDQWVPVFEVPMERS